MNTLFLILACCPHCQRSSVWANNFGNIRISNLCCWCKKIYQIDLKSLMVIKASSEPKVGSNIQFPVSICCPSCKNSEIRANAHENVTISNKCKCGHYYHANFEDGTATEVSPEQKPRNLLPVKTCIYLKADITVIQKLNIM